MDKTVAELKGIAKRIGLKGYSTLKKSELVKVLKQRFKSPNRSPKKSVKRSAKRSVKRSAKRSVKRSAKRSANSIDRIVKIKYSLRDEQGRKKPTEAQVKFLVKKEIKPMIGKISGSRFKLLKVDGDTAKYRISNWALDEYVESFLRKPHSSMGKYKWAATILRM